LICKSLKTIASTNHIIVPKTEITKVQHKKSSFSSRMIVIGEFYTQLQAHYDLTIAIISNFTAIFPTKSAVS